MTWTSVEFQAEALAMCRTDWNREHRGSAESRNGSPNCDESGKGDGLWNGFSVHCVIVWKKVWVGNNKHLKLKKKKKKTRGKVEGSQKLRLSGEEQSNQALAVTTITTSFISIIQGKREKAKSLLGILNFVSLKYPKMSSIQHFIYTVSIKNLLSSTRMMIKVYQGALEGVLPIWLQECS